MMKNRFLPIRTWFTVTLMIFALVPTLGVGFLLNWSVSKSENEAGIRRIIEVSRRMTGDVELLINGAESTADLLVGYDSLRDAAQRLNAGTDRAHEIEIYRDLLKALSLVESAVSFSAIRVFLPESSVITHEKDVFFSLDDLEQAEPPLRQSILSSLTGWTGLYERHVLGVAGDTPMVTYYREGAQVQSSRVLVVAVDIEESMLLSILRKNDGLAGSFSLYDSGGNLIASASGGMEEEDNPYTVITEAGEWTLETRVPLSQFTGINSGTSFILLGTLLVCILLIPILAALAARRPSEELRRLEMSSQKAIDGEYETVPVNGTIHEVRTLQLAYNAMMDNISGLIHDVYEARLQQQEARMSILFEQIRPHFLYNTLESAKWLAAKNGDEATMVFLEKLAQFFRLGLSGGEEFVPLRQELRHVSLYTELMASRTGKSVTFIQQAPEELLDIPMMKLTLQPLVENAIEHGVMQKESQTGTVTVSVRDDGPMLEITVRDDGVGIDPGKLPGLNGSGEAGYGTRNIRKRLELCYGERCTLLFCNNEEGGAGVRIRFPKDGAHTRKSC